MVAVRRGDVCPAGVLRQPKLRGVAQCLPDGQCTVHDVVLGHVADIRKPRANVDAAYRHAAFRGHGHARKGFDERGLSAAARPNDRNQLAWLNSKGGRDENRLAVDRHRDPFGIQAKRAPVVAAEQARSVEQQPEGSNPDLRSSHKRRAPDRATVEPGPVRGAGVAELYAVSPADDGYASPGLDEPPRATASGPRDPGEGSGVTQEGGP